MSDERPVKSRSKLGGYRIPEERFQAARVLYETLPGMTFDKLAEHTGVSARSLEDRSRADGTWSKMPLLPPKNMSDAAQAVADHYTKKVTEFGDEITEEQKKVALVDTAVEVAVDLRAQLLDRHRREWDVLQYHLNKNLDPRNTMADKEKFERAKFIKITAETIQIKQAGQRKAWGIEQAGDDQTQNGVTVVIERA